MNKVKRIAAIIGIVLIVLMYVITFISALLIPKYSSALFWASLFCTFAVPVFIYAFLLIHKLINKNENTLNLDQLKKLGDSTPHDKETRD